MKLIVLSTLVLVLGCNKGTVPPSSNPGEPSAIGQPAAAKPASGVSSGGSCGGLSVEDCNARPDCETIKAQRVLQGGTCTGAVTPVGCMDTQQPCDDALTYAVDPTEAGWWFMDTCIPSGWTVQASTGDGVPPRCEGSD